MNDIGVLAAVLVVYSLLSRRLERLLVSGPMFFVAAGMLLGPDVLDIVHIDLTGSTGLVVAEVALVIVLFTDAGRINLGALREASSLPARLLGIGMPLTIGLGVGAGALLLTDLEFWEAAIVAAVLAPTDAALGQAVVSSKKVPQRIRQALNVESGLNDGLAIPFLFLFTGLAITGTQVSPTGWFAFAGEQIGYGTVAGLLVGAGGGWLIDRAMHRNFMTGVFRQLIMVGLAILAWSLAEAIGGNGFIAAFVAGLSAGRVTEHYGEDILDFSEDEGHLLNLTVFFIFGVSAIGFLKDAGWEIYVFGLLALTLVRMLPVMIALAGTGLRWTSVAFMGWFGPRGLASIILALIVIEEEPELPAVATIFAAMTVTVLGSIFLHGISARPLSRAYAASIAEAEEDEPELQAVIPHPVRVGFRSSDKGDESTTTGDSS